MKRVPMTIIGVLTYVILVQVTYGCTDKDAVPRLPDLQRRASAYSAGSTIDETLVNDFYLNSGWYSVQPYTMATNSPVPDLGTCGTQYPIYIRGNAPENSNIPNNTEVKFDACLRSYFDNCDLTYKIRVRNCSGELQYFLKTTERYSSYCFDPTGTGPSDVSLGEITVKPNLQFDKKQINDGFYKYNPFLEFECNFNQQPEYFYSVKWYSNDKLIESLGPSQNMSYLSLKEKESLNLTLGVNFQCGVSVSAYEDGVQTATELSIKYFAGIKFSNLRISLSKTSNAYVTFKITVPIGCRYAEPNNEECLLDLRMLEGANNCSNLVSQGFCGVRIKTLMENETWNPNIEYNVSILTRDESYADEKEFVLNFETQGLGHKIWRDYQPDSVDVIVTDTEVYKGKYCYSHVDPHMRTSDGVLYEHQRLGTYVLYRNKKYNIEVQEQTHRCNNNRATCICGVVIRAGADVLMFNTCGRLQFIEFKECGDGGILRAIRINDFLYRVHTPIGTYIEILVRTKYPGSMNVNIYMSPKDYNNVVGLCGEFNGNKANDFKTSYGNVRPNNIDYVFSESWKVNSTNAGNMFRIDYRSPNTWSQENARFCYCNNTSVNDSNEATCATREGCIVTNSKDVTNKLCRVVVARKRRSISRRFALDTESNYSKLFKRSAVNITDDEANATCTTVIGSALVATDFTELLAPGEVEAKIEQCIYDVLDSDDLEAATVHVDALNAIATFHMDIDPEYVANNTDKVEVFKQQSCLSNCNSQGTCVDGECQCVEHFHGADCSIDERNPLIIDGVTEDGVCDMVNSDCNCFHVQTDNLIETFKFQYVKSEQEDGETYSLVESFSGNGEYLTLFEGIICFDSSTNQQAFLTHYNLSISNDGITYSDPAEIYVYDSTCQRYTTDANGRYNFNVMSGHCFISGVCYNENEKSQDNECNVCLPAYDTINWTSACSTHKEEEDKSFAIIIGGVVGGIAAVVVVAGIVVYCVKKSKKRISSNQDGYNHTANKYVRPQSAMSTRSQAEISVKFTTTPRDTVNGDRSANEYYKP